MLEIKRMGGGGVSGSVKGTRLDKRWSGKSDTPCIVVLDADAMMQHGIFTSYKLRRQIHILSNGSDLSRQSVTQLLR